ncbi:uncharacterized protein LOC124461686 [Drosophila willistoni]|uniref:uncharacterized protein LOC124461686 n=1 Tax=Drosophila willistoni TaxID=7260 RepID=UPI001F074590|nr:uncharacterized protein LOC124461686 [Drosophila willistoni]
MTESPELFAEVYTQCLREGSFPARWKGGSKKYCLVVTLDVKNAFNTADRGRILDALQSFSDPAYLRAIVWSYFHGRRFVYSWMSSVGLSLAAQKTEAVLISSRKIVETATILIDGNTVQSKRAIRYLGVWIDTRLSFRVHLAYVNEKASASVRDLSRIMPNTRGPKQESRKLLMTAKEAEIISATERGSLARDASIDLWQARWDASDKGGWTHRLIPNIKKWTERTRFGHDSSQCCPVCPGEIVEDAQHILFVCRRFDHGRRALELEANVEICSENLVDLMMARKSMWEAVNSFAASPIRELRLAEHGRAGPGMA